MDKGKPDVSASELVTFHLLTMIGKKYRWLLIRYDDAGISCRDLTLPLRGRGFALVYETQYEDLMDDQGRAAFIKRLETYHLQRHVGKIRGSV